jgi:hypothetical protein
MYGQEQMGIWARIKNRKKKSLHRSYFSTRNHWLLLLKDLDVLSGLVLFPRLFIAEVARLGYIATLEWKNTKAIFDALKLVPRIWKKRKNTMQTKVVSGRVIRKTFAE